MVTIVLPEKYRRLTRYFNAQTKKFVRIDFENKHPTKKSDLAHLAAASIFETKSFFVELQKITFIIIMVYIFLKPFL